MSITQRHTMCARIRNVYGMCTVNLITMLERQKEDLTDQEGSSIGSFKGVHGPLGMPPLYICPLPDLGDFN